MFRLELWNIPLNKHLLWYECGGLLMIFALGGKSMEKWEKFTLEIQKSWHYILKKAIIFRFKKYLIQNRVIFAHNRIHLSLLCTWYLFICNGVMTSLIPRLFLLCCAQSTSCPGSQCSVLNVRGHVVTALVWSLVHISHSDEHQIQYSDLKWA